jgi:hypothetical protein
MGPFRPSCGTTQDRNDEHSVCKEPACTGMGQGAGATPGLVTQGTIGTDVAATQKKSV